MGYLESLSAYFSCDIGTVKFGKSNIQARSEDERVPAEYDNLYQLERPNRPTRFTTDRATDPTDRDAVSESLLYL